MNAAPPNAAPLNDAAVEDAAKRLLDAAATGVPCAPVRDLIGADDIAAAYTVQRAVNRARRSRVVGRKVGLTAAAIQRQLGVDQPDFGVLFDDMDVSGSVPASRVLQPRIEAEVAFVLGADLAGPLSAARVRGSVDYAVAALEIVGSRITGWDITIADTVADNASSGLFVLGADRVGLDRFEPRDAVMEMTVDGTVVSTGTGAACLGDPLAALAWLAETADRFGDPLRAGDVVLSGALGPMVPVVPGIHVAATVSGLGPVGIRFL